MRIDATTAFSLGDLAVLDATHLRQVIGEVPGAVSPALVGWAFASDRAAATRHLGVTARPELPFHVLGVKPPRDLCWLTVRK